MSKFFRTFAVGFLLRTHIHIRTHKRQRKTPTHKRETAKTMEENKQFDKKSLRYVIGKTADFGELAKDCVAFANTNGGFLAIGIEDDVVLPDVEYAELEKTVRAMARNAEIKPIGGRKYRKYSAK